MNRPRGLRGGGVGDDIDATVKRARAWGVPARWTISTASTPAGFEAALEARGLVFSDEWAGMVAPIESLPAPEPLGATIEIVNNVAQSHEWADVLADAFGVGGDVAAHVREAHSWPAMHDLHAVLHA